MSTGDMFQKYKIHSSLTFVMVALSLAGCAQNSIDGKQAEGSTGRNLLSNLRPKADPSLVARISEEERKEAEKQSQANIVMQTGGAEQIAQGLGRSLPKVSTDPFSTPIFAPPAENISANGTIISDHKENSSNDNKAVYHPAAQSTAQLASYETSYNAVPPPPPGALGAGLVPPPPAVTLSTQAQAMADSAAAFYNNPYFNPFGAPAPNQAALPSRRPAGLFAENNSSDQNDSQSSPKRHKADFVPITPKGMEARSPYKQRDDFRILWKGALKSSVNLGSLSENPKLIDDLMRQDIGLPTESTKGSFNVSARQIESLFKSSIIDKRAFSEIRKLQTELVQSYYRYLSSYNKYALAEQTVSARKQEIELSDSDSEKQRATADLSQAQTDLDASKEDLHSAEIELAADSSPAAARTIISHVAGIAPSIESLAQGVNQSNNSGSTNHSGRIVGFFDSVFKHQKAAAAETSTPEDTDLLPSKSKPSNSKIAATKKEKDKPAINKNISGLFGRMIHSSKENETASGTNKTVAKSNKTEISDTDNDLISAPASELTSKDSNSFSKSENTVSANNTSNKVNFILKNVSINPRKSVLSVVVKNLGAETFELNPDTIYIAEGNRKLGASALRADFDNTSIESNQEVKGTITVFSRPWNDRLVIYLVDGNKTVQLKR